jgi:hypothetical protein
VKVATFEHTLGSGWSVDEFPQLDSERTLVLVFGAREYLEDARAIGELREAYPTAHLLGCSSSGEIHGTKVSDSTLSVAVSRFEKGRVDTVSIEVNALEESFEAGRQLANALDGEDLTGLFVLSKGTEINGTKLVEGISDVLGDKAIVTGGLAGDGDRFERTWVLDGQQPNSKHVSAVALYGDDLRISHGSKGGWDRFGPEREVTRSEGSVLYELDGKPALDLYKRYLGDQADGLPATGLLFPLEIQGDGDQRLVRTILAIDEDEQSMIFAGDIPQGAKVQLMKGNFDRLVDGACGAAEHCVEMSDHQGGEALAIAVSCVGRRLILKHRTEDELEAVVDALPESAHLVGFYSYGELSPHMKGAACALHNQTMTLTVISEQ